MEDVYCIHPVCHLEWPLCCVLYILFICGPSVSVCERVWPEKKGGVRGSGIIKCLEEEETQLNRDRRGDNCRERKNCYFGG